MIPKRWLRICIIITNLINSFANSSNTQFIQFHDLHFVSPELSMKSDIKPQPVQRYFKNLNSKINKSNNENDQIASIKYELMITNKKPNLYESPTLNTYDTEISERRNRFHKNYNSQNDKTDSKLFELKRSLFPIPVKLQYQNKPKNFQEHYPKSNHQEYDLYENKYPKVKKIVHIHHYHHEHNNYPDEEVIKAHEKQTEIMVEKKVQEQVQEEIMKNLEKDYEYEQEEKENPKSDKLSYDFNDKQNYNKAWKPVEFVNNNDKKNKQLHTWKDPSAKTYKTLNLDETNDKNKDENLYKHFRPHVYFNKYEYDHQKYEDEKYKSDLAENAKNISFKTRTQVSNNTRIFNDKKQFYELDKVENFDNEGVDKFDDIVKKEDVKRDKFSSENIIPKNRNYFNEKFPNFDLNNARIEKIANKIKMNSEFRKFKPVTNRNFYGNRPKHLVQVENNLNEEEIPPNNIKEIIHETHENSNLINKQHLNNSTVIRKTDAINNDNFRKKVRLQRNHFKESGYVQNNKNALSRNWLGLELITKI